MNAMLPGLLHHSLDKRNIVGAWGNIPESRTAPVALFWGVAPGTRQMRVIASITSDLRLLLAYRYSRRPVYEAHRMWGLLLNLPG